MNAERYLPLALLAAIRAGAAIQVIYDTDFSVDIKDDRSPLTQADRNAHEVISHTLRDTFPLLSEEGKHTPFEERKHWTTFWLVDPLDGTKEFIKRNGEFTVNIALIDEGTPILGVVYVPVTQKIYWGLQDKGSFTANVTGDISVKQLDALISAANTLNEQTLPECYTIVASRSHLNIETGSFIEACREKHGEVHLANYGSSLKLCMVAERKAD